MPQTTQRRHNLHVHDLVPLMDNCITITPDIVAPRYNAVVGVHEMEPRFKRVSIIALYSARGATTPKTLQQQPKPMCMVARCNA